MRQLLLDVKQSRETTDDEREDRRAEEYLAFPDCGGRKGEAESILAMMMIMIMIMMVIMIMMIMMMMMVMMVMMMMMIQLSSTRCLHGKSLNHPLTTLDPILW